MFDEEPLRIHLLLLNGGMPTCRRALRWNASRFSRRSGHIFCPGWNRCLTSDVSDCSLDHPGDAKLCAELAPIEEPGEFLMDGATSMSRHAL